MIRKILIGLGALLVFVLAALLLFDGGLLKAPLDRLAKARLEPQALAAAPHTRNRAAADSLNAFRVDSMINRRNQIWA